MTLIRIRRGKESERGQVTPRLGEPLFTTDSKRLYVGDGVSPGGIAVGTGEPGEGVPAGGATGQVLSKRSNIAYDTEWVDQEEAGVSSVNGRTGAVAGLAEDSALAEVAGRVETLESGATMNTDSSLAGNAYFLDEDDMASNSATKVPSQQSVKAYTDATVADAVSDMAAAVFLLAHPVGEIFKTMSSTNPGTIYGGTWVKRKEQYADTGWQEYSWKNATYINTGQSSYTRNQWRIKDGMIHIHAGAGAASAISTTSEDELARIPVKGSGYNNNSTQVWNGAVGGSGAVYGFKLSQSANYMSVQLKPHTTANNHTAPWFSSYFSVPIEESAEITAEGAWRKEYFWERTA